MPKFPVNKGFHGFESDDEEFLKPSSTNPRRASASGEGYNSRWSDDRGYARGAQSQGSDDAAFLRASSSFIDADDAHERLSGLIDDSQPYAAQLAGGAPLTKGKGVGSGPARYKAKTGPRTNGGQN